jgi:Arm DNA-binding domain
MWGNENSSLLEARCGTDHQRNRKRKPGAKRYKLADGEGFCLLVLPSGGKLWLWRYRLDGAEKNMTFGDYPHVSPKTWNRAEFAKPRYRGVGTALLTAAIDLSLEEGFHGRIGLHSLTQAESFYRNACGMSDLGIDSNYDNLRYFEMTSEQAAAFLG